jgi:hypothetical protein
MQYTYEEVQQFASELPPEERMLLANSILETVNLDELAQSDPAWEAEIELRVAEIKGGTAETFSLHELAEDMRKIVGS